MGVFNCGDAPIACTGTCKLLSEATCKCRNLQSFRMLVPVHTTESKPCAGPSPRRDSSWVLTSADKSLAHSPPKHSSTRRSHSSSSVASLLQKSGMSLSPASRNFDRASMAMLPVAAASWLAPDAAQPRSVCLLRHSATRRGPPMPLPGRETAGPSARRGMASSPPRRAREGTRASSRTQRSWRSSGIGGSESRRRLSMTCARLPSAVFVSWNQRKPASLKILSTTASRANLPAASSWE
mmetsp:Transcript_150580/g.419695  ORF Transcript_150580/g.419695 Transcript_150580/m.419695 type:complete len:239 (-) Transcript_150580:202-918(-)